MSNYNEVREWVAEQLKSVQSGLIIWHHVPRTTNIPAAIIQADPNRTIDYEQAFSSSSAEWHFNVMIIVGLVNEAAAQKRVGDLISPGSDLLKALNVKGGNGYSRVRYATVQEMTLGEPPKQGLYTYARLSLIVRV